MYKSIWALTLAISLLLSLTTACSSNTNSGNTTTESAPAATEQTEAAATQEPSNTDESSNSDTNETKLYVDAQGREVEIPANPKNIIALWTVGELLALGEKPVGSTDNLLRFYTEEDRTNVEIVGEGVTGDYEKMLALEPDLIIVYARATEEELEQYSKIAPTVTTPFYGDPFETFRSIANILNKQDEAEQWLADYQARVEEARDKTKDMNLQEQSALVLQVALKNIYLYKSSTFPVIYDDYQFKLTDKQLELQKDPAFGSVEVSQEILPEFSADHIFVFINDDESQQVYEELKKSTIWNELKAVKNGNLHEISNRIAVNDVTTMDWAIDEVYRLLTE